VKRIEKEFKKDKVHKELYNSILSVADEHFKTGKNHVEQYDETDKKTHHHAHMALHHKTKAEELYDILLAKDVRKVLKHLALTKFSEVCEKLIENSEEIAANIQKAADYAEKNKTGEELNNCLYHINHKVLEQNLVLRHFALSYSKALIHSAEFLDSQSDKIILYVHK
jgi:hypothetical protein